jgi:hypothetical protein
MRIPSRIPKMAPMTAYTMTSAMTVKKISARVAPTALRIPWRRWRRETEKDTVL